MIWTLLIKSFHGGKLRNGSGNPGKTNTKRTRHDSRIHNGAHFVSNTLLCHKSQTRCRGRQCVRCFFLNRKSQFACKANGSEHAQGIFFKATLCISYGTDTPLLKIMSAMVGIQQSAPWMKRHGVHRKITTSEVLVDTVNKAHLIRVAVIRIGAFSTIGCYFKRVSTDNNGNGTVLGTGFMYDISRCPIRLCGLFPVR